MAEEKKRPDEDGAKESAPKKDGAGGNKMMFLGILVGVIILNTVIAIVLVQVTKPKKAVEAEAKAHVDSTKHLEESHAEMGAFTEAPIEVVVNIAGTDGERFLKAGVVFEFDEIKYPLLGEELGKWSNKFKDILIDHLSKLTLMEVTEPEAKDKIRKELLRAINNSMPPKDGEIKDVLFTQYIIQ